MRSTKTGRFTKVHGLGGTRIAKIWQGMMSRCSHRERDDFPLYGGRGIKVCERWQGSLLAFSSDMGPPPRGKTLDRIDNDGDYSPENCRWSTPKQQARNRRSTRWITFRGRTQAMAAWAEEIGLKNGTLHWRLKHGWTVERALGRQP